MATKRKFTAVERFFIEGNRHRPPKDIAAALGCSVRAVETALANLAPAPPPPPPDPVPAPQHIPGNETATGAPATQAVPATRPEGGVTVMTGAASQWADESKPEAYDYNKANADRIYRR